MNLDECYMIPIKEICIIFVWLEGESMKMGYTFWWIHTADGKKMSSIKHFLIP